MPRAAAALLLCLAGSALAAPRSRGTLLRAEHHDISAPLTLLAAAPAEDNDEEIELGPRPVPHEMQAAPPSRDPVLQDSVAPLCFPGLRSPSTASAAAFSAPAPGHSTSRAYRSIRKATSGPSTSCRSSTQASPCSQKTAVLCSDPSPRGRCSRASVVRARPGATATGSSSTTRSPTAG